MNNKQWKIWQPILSEMKFGDNVYKNSDRYKFLGLSYREDERYTIWDTERGVLSMMYLQTEKELKWYNDYENKKKKRRKQKSLPWYNIKKYI